MQGQDVFSNMIFPGGLSKSKVDYYNGVKMYLFQKEWPCPICTVCEPSILYRQKGCT